MVILYLYEGVQIISLTQSFCLVIKTNEILKFNDMLIKQNRRFLYTLILSVHFQVESVGYHTITS